MSVPVRKAFESAAEEPIQRVCAAAADKETLEWELDQADLALSDAVKEAYAEGVPLPEIAQASGESLAHITELTQE